MRFVPVLVALGLLAGCLPDYEEPTLRASSLDPTTDMNCDEVYALANEEIARTGQFRWTRFCRAFSGHVVAVRKYETFKGTMADYIADVTAILSGNTILWTDPIGGYEVAFHDTDGITYHWRANDMIVKRSRWKVENALVCMTKPGGTLAREDAEWFCEQAEEAIARTLAIREGDMFKLKLGTAPFVLKEDQIPEGF
mgnify:CR=1 FL=1